VAKRENEKDVGKTNSGSSKNRLRELRPNVKDGEKINGNLVYLSKNRGY